MPGVDLDQACGKTGSACIQKCETSTHNYGECQLPSGPVDTENDTDNCGQCGNVCPTPVHASFDGGTGAACRHGMCGRGTCEPGWYDFDREATFGCEVRCGGDGGTTCWLPDGATITVSAPPLPERGLVFQAFASGSSLAGGLGLDGGSYMPFPQTNSNYTNVGILGESTPLACGSDGGCSPTMSNATHKLFGGFMAIDHK